MLKKLICMMRRHSAYKNSVSQLSGMTDAQLKDIGINRCNIREISWQYAIRKFC